MTHTHTETEKENKKRANGKIIPFVHGMAMTGAGTDNTDRAGGQGGGHPEIKRTVPGWPANLV